MKPKRETTRLVTALVGAVALFAVATTTNSTLADGPSVCSTRDKVIAALSDVYSERPVSIGLTAEGAVIEVMASAEGSFTIVVTHPNGLTCPLAAGKAWQSVTAQFVGDGV